MRRILTGTKIGSLIPSPLVYVIAGKGLEEREFMQALNTVSRTMRNSWAYSTEYTTNKVDKNYNIDTTTRRYFTFSSELDAMQFALTFDAAKRAYLWPSSVIFTAHLFEDSESSEHDQEQTK